MSNFARVVPAQAKYLELKDTERYTVVKKGVLSGILILKDKTPEKPEELLELGTSEKPKGPPTEPGISQ